MGAPIGRWHAFRDCVHTESQPERTPGYHQRHTAVLRSHDLRRLALPASSELALRAGHLRFTGSAHADEPPSSHADWWSIAPSRRRRYSPPAIRKQDSFSRESIHGDTI